MPNSSFCNFLSTFKNGSLASYPYSSSRNTFFVKRCCFKLLNDGFLERIRFSKSNKIITFWFKNIYFRKNLFSKIRLFSVPSKPIYITKKSLQKLNKKGSYALISTPKGLYNNYECKLYNLSGILLFVIF